MALFDFFRKLFGKKITSVSQIIELAKKHYAKKITIQPIAKADVPRRGPIKAKLGIQLCLEGKKVVSLFLGRDGKFGASARSLNAHHDRAWEAAIILFGRLRQSLPNVEVNFLSSTGEVMEEERLKALRLHNAPFVSPILPWVYEQ